MDEHFSGHIDGQQNAPAGDGINGGAAPAGDPTKADGAASAGDRINGGADDAPLGDTPLGDAPLGDASLGDAWRKVGGGEAPSEDSVRGGAAPAGDGERGDAAPSDAPALSGESVRGDAALALARPEGRAIGAALPPRATAVRLKRARDPARKRAWRRAGKMLARLLRRAVALALVLAAALGAYAYFVVYKGVVGASRNEYLTVLAETKDVAAVVSAVGNVSAKDEVSLYINAAQKAARVHVKAGDSVRKGDVLIEFDVADERKRLMQKRSTAEINLKNAELTAQSIAQPASGNELLQYNSDVENAENNVRESESEIESKQIRINQQELKVADAKKALDNNAELLASGFATQDEYDVSESAHKNAVETLRDLELQKQNEERRLEHRQAQLADSQRKLANAKNRLSDASTALRYEQQMNIAELSRIEIEQIDMDLADLAEELASPIDGNVVSVYTAQGGTVPRGAAAVTLADMSATLVKSDISEYDAPLVALGQGALVSTSALPDKAYVGTVTRISSGSVEKDGSSDKEVIVPVEITLDDPDGLLKTGYTVDIEIITQEAKGALSVPAQSIFYDEAGGAFVYVMKPAHAPGVGGATAADAADDATSADANADDAGAAGSGAEKPAGRGGIMGAADAAFAAVGRARAALDAWLIRILQLDQDAGDADGREPFRVAVETGLFGQNGVEITGGALRPGDEVRLP